MSKRKRRNHSPSFKAKVAMAAIRGDKTLAELAQQYDVHPNQIQDWKKRLMAEAEHVFENGNGGSGSGREEEVGKLHAKIGELTMERDFHMADFSYGRFLQVTRNPISHCVIHRDKSCHGSDG